MSTNIQQAREALGARLRELRQSAGLTGLGLAQRLDWPQSKVSKIETGRQAPAEEDIRAWTSVSGYEEAVEGLLASLRSLESMYAEWRRQFRGGMRARQQSIADLETRSQTIRAFASTIVPGLLQTPDYARTLMAESIEFHEVPDDLDQAVHARMRRQEILYQQGKQLHFVITESALRHRVCDRDVLVGQLDRLLPLSTMRNVRFGIIPFDTRYRFAPPHEFWLFDSQMVLVETVAAELRLNRPEEITTYRRAFDRLAATASYGGEARQVVGRVMDGLSQRA